MLFNAGRNRKDIGIENDVLWRKTNASEQVISALAYLYLALLGVGLARLVKGHHHHCCAVSHAFAGLL